MGRVQVRGALPRGWQCALSGPQEGEMMNPAGREGWSAGEQQVRRCRGSLAGTEAWERLVCWGSGASEGRQVKAAGGVVWTRQGGVDRMVCFPVSSLASSSLNDTFPWAHLKDREVLILLRWLAWGALGKLLV